MRNKTLPQLYAEHAGKVSDKWSLYLTEYERIFHDFRGKPITLLEIGIQNGGSLEIWSKYFRHAQKLLGCDFNPDCLKLRYGDPRIAVIVGNANSDTVQVQILKHATALDVIIDDGSHRSSDIIKSFARYFPHLANEGVYIVEDLHCSYWKECEGGLFDPYSSITFFKRLTDIINHEHWGMEKEQVDILSGFFSKYDFQLDTDVLQHVHSIEFINSLCVIHKARPERNRLGARTVAGAVEMVASGYLKLRGSQLGPDLVPDQSGNEWTARILPPDEELLLRNKELAERDGQIANLNQVVAERDGQIANLNQVVAERDGQIATLNHAVAERDGQIATLNHAVAERDGQIATLNQVVAERDRRIAHLKEVELHRDALLASTSWRLTKPLRIVGHQLKRLRHVWKLLPNIFAVGGGLRRTSINAFRVMCREGLAGVKERIAYAATGKLPSPRSPVPSTESPSSQSYDEWIRRYDTLTEDTRAEMRQRSEAFAIKPLISVVMPACNPKLESLEEAIESVRRQIYPYWELCIADDATTDPRIRKLLDQYAAKDTRVKVLFRAKHGHISAASNSALTLATGKYIALMDHDDTLAEHALYWVADAINRCPEAGIIYSDEDKVDDTGRRGNPYFKCDWNYDLFLSQNFMTHIVVYRTSLVLEVGWYGESYKSSEDYELALRCIEKLRNEQIVHVPRILYHSREHAGSAAVSDSNKSYAHDAGRHAIIDHLTRKKVAAEVMSVPVNGLSAPTNYYRVRYAVPEPAPRVSLIIPTRNGLALLRQCVSSILEKTDYPNYEILIVDNGSDDPNVLAYMESLRSDKRIRILRDDRPFNFSALNNRAVMEAEGDLIGLINNDTKVITRGWLAEMVSIAAQPSVGVVGARLWYPDDTLQHGGVILGVRGVAGHSHRKSPRNSAGYFGRAALLQSISAVTAACCVIRKDIYWQAGGMDDVNLKVAFNDTEFCLKVRELGYRNVWTPYAELYHHESATRGYEDNPEKEGRFAAEVAYMKHRWGNILRNDPAYNPNLTLERDDFSLAWPPRVSPCLDATAAVHDDQASLAFTSNTAPQTYERDSVINDRLDKLDIYAVNNEFRAAEVRSNRQWPQLALQDRRPGLSVVVLNLNKPELIVPLVKHLRLQQELFRRNGLTLEIVVGDTGSAAPETLACLRELQQAPDCVVLFGLQYHFSRCNNHLAFAHSSCEMLLFLNNDVIFDRDTALLELYHAGARHPDVGVFGALLFFPDGTVQHAGVDFFRNPELRGLCYHPLSRARKTENSFPKVIEAPAATGAFLGIRAALFQEIGGFDEEYTAECQDIALCLAARRHGFSAQILNLGTTVHLENATRPKNEENWADRQRFLRKWGGFIDAMFL